jgi:hypothetical protein
MRSWAALAVVSGLVFGTGALASEPSIVGTWRQVHAVPDRGTVSHTYYVFKADGTVTVHYWDNLNGRSEGGTWSWRKGEGNEYIVSRFVLGRNDQKMEVHDRVTLLGNGERISYPNGTPFQDDILHRVR